MTAPRDAMQGSPWDGPGTDVPRSAGGEAPSFDSLPPFRSRRAAGAGVDPHQPEAEPNGFGGAVAVWAVGAALGSILVGFGIWIGVALS
jgi:hypothetical protein